MTTKGNCPFCGKVLNFKPSHFYSNERRECPHCKRLVYADRDLVEYEKLRCDNARVSERS